MAIPRGHRFEIQFASAFPQGLVLIGDVAPDNEYQTREEKAAGRPVRQKIDTVTGKRQWKATVTDPDEPNAKRASFEITFVADVQPVPTTTEVLPAMRHRTRRADGRTQGRRQRRVQVSVLPLPGNRLHGDDQYCRVSVVAVDQAGRQRR